MSEQFKIGPARVPLQGATSEWKFEHRPGGWVVATRLKDGKRFRFQSLEAAGALSLAAGGRLYHGTIEQPKRGGSGGGASDADLIAQFPGKVRKVLVAEGAAVKQGEPLVLVEAMKMEFAIQAPADGIVKKLLVKEGQQLAPGDRFLDFHAGAPK
jgi:3-methylcrotonyl-CoA carboxylase alpha subunit